MQLYRTSLKFIFLFNQMHGLFAITLRCLINGRGGGQNKRDWGRGFLLNLINGGGGISKNPLISVINEKKDIHV